MRNKGKENFNLQIIITKNQNIKVKEISDNLKVMLEQYKPVDFSTLERKGYIISKTYKNAKDAERLILVVVLPTPPF